MASYDLVQLVYFIQSGESGPIKIGVAADPRTRLRHMQTGSPEKLVLLGTRPGGIDREQEIHAHLAAHRIRGEWFRPVAEVLAHVPGIEVDQLCAALGGVSNNEAISYKLHAAMNFYKTLGSARG